MPRPRFYKLAEDKRETILAAAKSEFAERGFDGASYNRIIELAGLSKGAMYYYFDDKLDLYVTVLEEVSEVMFASMPFEGWQPEGDFWDAVRDMTLRAWEFAIVHPELAALWKGVGALPRKARNEGRLGELYDRFRQMTRAMLAAGQAQGQVRTDRSPDLLVEVAIALDEALDFWLIDHLDEVAEDPAEEVVDMVVDFWRRLLRPE